MKRVVAILGVALGLMAGGANASLYDRGNGMVYDDVLKITWGPRSVGTWTDVNAWANNLVYGGHDDWRLPALRNPNVNGPCGPLGQCSEMAYMYYKNYGKVVGWNSIHGSGDQAPLPPNAENWLLFPMRGNYWSVINMPFEPNTGFEGTAHYFDFNLGVPGTEYVYKYRDVSGAVAVRNGDVANVPVPATLALLGLGLAGIGAARRKQA